MISAAPRSRTRRAMSNACRSLRHSKIAPTGACLIFCRHEAVELRHRIGRDAELEIAVGVEPDHSLMPAVGLPHHLMHRQRIDIFVGEDDGPAAFRNVEQAAMPGQRDVDIAQRAALQLLERRADLHHVNRQRLAEGRQHLGGTQCIAHHGAAPGSKLDQPQSLGLVHHPPHRQRPQPEQLAENLADLGRGGEIAAARRTDRA